MNIILFIVGNPILLTALFIQLFVLSQPHFLDLIKPSQPLSFVITQLRVIITHIFKIRIIFD